LFFGTNIKDKFKITRWPLEDGHELVIAKGNANGCFLFQETRWDSRVFISPSFYHMPEMDFSSVLEGLWKAYPHGLHLSLGEVDGIYGSREVTYQNVPAIGSEVLTNKGRERLSEVLNNCRADTAAAISRCYIAVGPAGTGKTSLVQRVATELGGKLLCIDATSLSAINTKALGVVLGALQPQVILIDDFDRAVEGTSARLLFLLR
jgi:hypothetical protein